MYRLGQEHLHTHEDILPLAVVLVMMFSVLKLKYLKSLGFKYAGERSQLRSVNVSVRKVRFLGASERRQLCLFASFRLFFSFASGRSILCRNVPSCHG